MRMLRTLLLAAAMIGGLSGAPALADPPREANRAFEGVREGRSMPLPQLERRVMPMMGGAPPGIEGVGGFGRAGGVVESGPWS